jgi:hypothetical protein
MSIKFTYLLIFALLVGSSLANNLKQGTVAVKVAVAQPAAPAVVKPTPPKVATPVASKADPITIKK